MSKAPTLAPDAAMVLGIAATAIPFARTPEEEAERWLRLLRLHGEVGAVLQALGVSEDSLRAHATKPVDGERFAEAVNPEHRDVIALVTEHAARAAADRGAPGITTVDVLMAVMEVYGTVFERALHAHGTDADEVLQRLAA
ncbi:MAG: hypothetical protein QOG40_9 [Solirubrobacteraceae bacterium]|jgi:hypothetical protein|nr:hypothetical protein [Solirubrobacteraceae bacterium]